MRRATCSFPTSSPVGHRLEANVSYVVPEPFAAEWFNAAPDGVRISTLKSFERPYFGHDLAGKSLWISRGCGFGDQLVLSGILREIKRRWPSCRLVFSTHTSASLLFGSDEPDSEAAQLFTFGPDVLPFDEWAAYDFHKPVEEIIELDREPDQTDIWTTHFRFFGLPNAARDPAACRPVNIVTQKARDLATAFLATTRDQRPETRDLILYQLSATSPIRSQSPARVTECLAAIRDAFPDHAVIAIGGREQAHIVIPDGVINCVGQHPRVMVGLIERAAAIVCPDSCVNHIAAGLDDRSPPVVSLWSSFDPARRIATYPNQFPIYNRLPCSPCFMHEVAYPPLGCPMYRGHCRGLDAIPPAHIIARLREALAARSGGTPAAVSSPSEPSVPSVANLGAPP